MNLNIIFVLIIVTHAQTKNKKWGSRELSSALMDMKIPSSYPRVAMKIPSRIDACCNSHENLIDLNLKNFSALIVLAEIASAKVLIFLLALSLLAKVTLGYIL